MGTPPPFFYVFCTIFHSSKYFLVNFWLKQPKLVGDFIIMVSLLLLASPVLRRPNPKKNMVLELTIMIISPYVHSRVDLIPMPDSRLFPPVSYFGFSLWTLRCCDLWASRLLSPSLFCKTSPFTSIPPLAGTVAGNAVDPAGSVSVEKEMRVRNNEGQGDDMYNKDLQVADLLKSRWSGKSFPSDTP